MRKEGFQAEVVHLDVTEPAIHEKLQFHPGWVKTEMGGENADLEVSEGGKTSAWLATLPNDGPTGGYFHVGQPLPR
jgi:hypothetical protein